MAVSNIITGIVNLVTFLLSIPLIGAGIWLSRKLDTECVKFLEWPIIVIGVVLLLVSLVGFIGACWRISWLLYVYLVVMFFIILALLVFIIFAFVVMKDGTSDGKVFRIQDYSPWLRGQVQNSGNWRKISSCIRDSRICSSLDSNYLTYAALSSADLSPLQVGCCMPPADCGFTYMSPTVWSSPTSFYGGDEDCPRWSNNQWQLCYGCSACQAGVLAEVKQGWRRVAVLSVVVLVALVVVYIVGCCAFRNAQTEDLFKRHEQRYASRSWRERNWFRGSSA